MLETVFQEVTGLFDRRALVSSFLPSFVFSALTVGVVLVGELGWDRTLEEWDQLGGAAQLVFGIGFVLLVAFWGFLLGTLRPALVQLLEGDRPAHGRLAALWGPRRRRWRKYAIRYDADDQQLGLRDTVLLSEREAWTEFWRDASTSMRWERDDATALEAFLTSAGPAPDGLARSEMSDDDLLQSSREVRSWGERVKAAPDDAVSAATLERLTEQLEAWHAATDQRLREVASARNSANSRALQFPPRPEDIMPTRLGNVLKTAEDHGRSRYGLDTVVIWPRLWALLPPEAREALAAARMPLDLLVTVSTFLVIFGLPVAGYLVFGAGVALWVGLVVAAVALVLAWLAYHCAVQAAIPYGEAIKSAIDVHRRLVLDALGLERPDNLGEERQIWQDVCLLLRRNDGGGSLRYARP
jgi:hypothetical protein